LLNKTKFQNLIVKNILSNCSKKEKKCLMGTYAKENKCLMGEMFAVIFSWRINKAHELV
jgi:hypothetical protein